jgi:hypothetical protein
MMMMMIMMMMIDRPGTTGVTVKISEYVSGLLW